MEEFDQYYQRVYLKRQPKPATIWSGWQCGHWQAALKWIWYHGRLMYRDTAMTLTKVRSQVRYKVEARDSKTCTCLRYLIGAGICRGWASLQGNTEISGEDIPRISPQCLSDQALASNGYKTRSQDHCDLRFMPTSWQGHDICDTPTWSPLTLTLSAYKNTSWLFIHRLRVNSDLANPCFKLLESVL